MPCLLLQQGEKLGKTGKTGKRETVNGKMSKIKSKLNCFVAVVRRCCSFFFTRMLFELSRASFVGNLIINQQAKPKWTVPKKKELAPHSPHTHTQLARAQSEAFYFVPIKWVIAADDPLKTQAICGYWRTEREGDAQSEWERERAKACERGRACCFNTQLEIGRKFALIVVCGFIFALAKRQTVKMCCRQHDVMTRYVLIEAFHSET